MDSAPQLLCHPGPFLSLPDQQSVIKCSWLDSMPQWSRKLISASVVMQVWQGCQPHPESDFWVIWDPFLSSEPRKHLLNPYWTYVITPSTPPTPQLLGLHFLKYAYFKTSVQTDVLVTELYDQWSNTVETQALLDYRLSKILLAEKQQTRSNLRFLTS